MPGTGWKLLPGSQSLKGIATPRRSSPYAHTKPLPPLGPSYTSLGAGICSWGCQADLHAVKLALYLLLLAKGEIVQVHATSVCERGFTNPARTFPAYTDFTIILTKPIRVPRTDTSLEMELDLSAQISMYLYIQLLEDAAGTLLQGARNRQELAQALRNAWPSLCQAPQLTAQAGCRCSAEPLRPTPPSQHMQQPPSKQHSPSRQEFLQVLCSQGLPLIELSLLRQLSPAAERRAGCARCWAVAPAHGQVTPLLEGQPSP